MHAHAPAAPPPELLRDASLFLDFDGTLVGIAEHPGAVRVDASLATLLTGLSERLEGRIAIVSGRPAADVQQLIGLHGITVSGSHGLEFLRPGTSVEMPPRPPALDRARDAMRDFAASHPGVLVEDKPLGAALHFRQAPAAERDCVALALQLVGDPALQLQHGKMMVEVRMGGGDKGSAIRTLMREPVFASATPVFLGDDLTDEPGFLAAQALGGSGVLIGDPRPTVANYRLSGVKEAIAWLTTACEAVA